MRDQAARAARQAFGERAGGDAAGGTRQHGIRARGAVQLGEQRLLGIHPFRPVLLHVFGVAHRIGQRRSRMDARCHRVRRFAEQSRLLQFRQPFGDEAECGLGLLRIRIPQRHVEPGAGEHDGPGAADQSCTDDGNLVVMFNLRDSGLEVSAADTQSQRVTFDPDWLQALAGRPELLTPEEMARADAASPALGCRGPTLMANAGRAVARAVRGDSGHAARWCWPARATTAATATSRRGCCSRRAGRSRSPHWRRRAPAPTRPMPQPRGMGRCAPFTPAEAARADLVIDAVFGAGLARDVDGIVADTLRAARRVVAVDVPSGLDGATGAVRGYAPQADADRDLLPPQAGPSAAAGPRPVRRDRAGRYRPARRRRCSRSRRSTFANLPALWRLPPPGAAATNTRAATSPCWAARR